MKNLLIAEMKRALELMEDPNIELRSWHNYKEVAELKQLLLMIRKHSILAEKGEFK